MSRDPWVQCYEPNPTARLRVFCLPFAGGTSAIYRGWGRALPAAVEVVPLLPPGRLARFREPPLRSVRELVREACHAIQPLLDRPYVLFGHSLGGLVAFEMTRELRRRGVAAPAELFVSATPGPPCRSEERPIHDLPDDELIRQVARMGGTPALVAENQELMRLLVPVLRADFAAFHAYRYQPEPPCGCPISVFGGLQDRHVDRSSLEAWRSETAAGCAIQMLPGDHFFVLSHRELLLGVLCEELERVLSRCPDSRAA